MRVEGYLEYLWSFSLGLEQWMRTNHRKMSIQRNEEFVGEVSKLNVGVVIVVDQHSSLGGSILRNEGAA